MTITDSAFTPGDLVISILGDGGDTGDYGFQQASPLTLDELTTGGTVVGQLVLPQTTTVIDGVTEYPISSQYASKSEGSLSLAANGQSLVIAGYAVNADTYNAGGQAVYGNAALAQSTSIQGGPYTAVARVIADISYTGAVDTSTAVYDIYNTNNPRSVVTIDGSSFYISGQGAKSGDTTQGVFLVDDGASTATAIDTHAPTQTLALYDGALYVSADSAINGGGADTNIARFGATLPTAETASAPLPGMDGSVILTAAQANPVNAGLIGQAVNLSPAGYFFADATTLYVADTGNPKQGGLGDGGLQKWTYDGTGWTLDYTLSLGLDLTANSGPGGSSTGLIGLTGAVVGDTVDLYATNYTTTQGTTVGETYVYNIADSLQATSLPADERFVSLMAAAPDSEIRGIAFAPEAPCFAAGTPILTRRGAVAVERLTPGDRVVTQDGRQLAVTWIGHRRIDCARHPEPVKVWPVRVRRDAFGPDCPRRDVFLSPDHAIFTEGVLIPVKHLIDGDAVRQMMVPSVTYFHVELTEHAVLLADGLPAESYLDTGDRLAFSGGTMMLHPAFGSELRDVTLIFDALGCAPLRVTGPEVERARYRVAGGADRVAGAVKSSSGPAGTMPCGLMVG